ncbi:MAG: GIY-YIG nuclease family protein [Patescibacteria group bacterium]
MPGTTTSNMFFYVYVLESLKDGERYIGITNDLKRRIEEHNNGRNFGTSYRRPFKLIYCEICTNEDDAKRREKYLKCTGGRRFLAKRLRCCYASRASSLKL